VSQIALGQQVEIDTTEVVINDNKAPLTFRQRAEACGQVFDLLEQIGVPLRDAVRIAEQVDDSLLGLNLHVVQ
jgi:hypothetical protein